MTTTRLAIVTTAEAQTERVCRCDTKRPTKSSNGYPYCRKCGRYCGWPTRRAAEQRAKEMGL